MEILHCSFLLAVYLSSVTIPEICQMNSKVSTSGIAGRVEVGKPPIREPRSFMFELSCVTI
jgi:hypothetical protein